MLQGFLRVVIIVVVVVVVVVGVGVGVGVVIVLVVVYSRRRRSALDGRRMTWRGCLLKWDRDGVGWYNLWCVWMKRGLMWLIDGLIG